MGKEKIPFRLMPGEEVLLVARPHPLAMVDLMAFWVFIAGLGVGFQAYHDRITGWAVTRLPRLEMFTFVAEHAYDLLWAAALIVPLIIMAIFRINFSYVLVLLLLLAARVLLWWKGDEVSKALPFAPVHLENYLLMAVGAAGAAGVELFRRGHRYYLTTHRIVARFGRLRVSERSILYSRINDLMLQKTLLGSLFNFGTVIPLTASGVGMGQDLALAGAQAGAGKGFLSVGLFAAGGKTKNVPRELSLYVLFRIKNPEQARNLILAEMEARECGAAAAESEEREG